VVPGFDPRIKLSVGMEGACSSTLLNAAGLATWTDFAGQDFPDVPQRLLTNTNSANMPSFPGCTAFCWGWNAGTGNWQWMHEWWWPRGNLAFYGAGAPEIMWPAFFSIAGFNDFAALGSDGAPGSRLYDYIAVHNGSASYSFNQIFAVVPGSFNGQARCGGQNPCTYRRLEDAALAALLDQHITSWENINAYDEDTTAPAGFHTCSPRCRRMILEDLWQTAPDGMEPSHASPLP
jgi:hypothetical protein